MTEDYGIEIQLRNYDDFLKVAETLTRIGIGSNKSKKLYQSCHILHKRGKYYITHFKELFKLDGKETEITEEDYGRRNTIAILLNDWGLIDIVGNISDVQKNTIPMNRLKVIAFREKGDWELVHKYTIGK